MLILEKGETKTPTGHTYLQNARDSQIEDITVGIISNNSITIPDILGMATSVVEKVARAINRKSLGQLLLSFSGHFRNNPKNLLLNSLILPDKGERKDPR